jgi:hypothetical protein
MQSQVKVEIHVASELEDPAARCADTHRPVHPLLTRHRASVRRLTPISTLTKKLPRAPPLSRMIRIQNAAAQEI